MKPCCHCFCYNLLYTTYTCNVGFDSFDIFFFFVKIYFGCDEHAGVRRESALCMSPCWTDLATVCFQYRSLSVWLIRQVSIVQYYIQCPSGENTRMGFSRFIHFFWYTFIIPTTRTSKKIKITFSFNKKIKKYSNTMLPYYVLIFAVGKRSCCVLLAS